MRKWLCIFFLSVTCFRGVVAVPLSSLDAMVFTLAEQEVRLLGIGETHLEKNRKRLYLELLPKLKNSWQSPICLLLETPEINEQPFLIGWPVKEALAMDIAVFGIDKPYAERQYDATKFPIESFNERDFYMANKIRELFTDGSCRFALLINGAKHYQTLSVSRVSLKTLLQNNFLSPTQLHFIKRKDDDLFVNEGATKWDWVNAKFKEFDSVIFGK